MTIDEAKQIENALRDSEMHKARLTEKALTLSQYIPAARAAARKYIDEKTLDAFFFVEIALSAIAESKLFDLLAFKIAKSIKAEFSPNSPDALTFADLIARKIAEKIAAAGTQNGAQVALLEKLIEENKAEISALPREDYHRAAVLNGELHKLMTRKIALEAKH